MQRQSKTARKNTGRGKSSKKKLLTKRNGIILIVFLAVLIFVINAITLSYAWFSPEVQPRTGMQYQTNLSIRSENCTIAQKIGRAEAVSGKIQYDDPWTAGDTSITVTAGTTQYFLATITNHSEYATNISLYIKKLPHWGAGESAPTLTDSFGMGVAAPSNTYRKYSEAQENIYILRNAYIEPLKNETPGTLEIEWFIKAGEEDVTVNLDDVYIMYN